MEGVDWAEKGRKRRRCGAPSMSRPDGPNIPMARLTATLAGLRLGFTTLDSIFQGAGRSLIRYPFFGALAASDVAPHVYSTLGGKSIFRLTARVSLHRRGEG